MNPCADKALNLLLRKAENAWAARSGRAVSLAFADSTFPDYGSLPSWEATAETNAALRNAERAGAVRLEWEKHAGDDRQITRVRLVDANVLGGLVGRMPLWAQCAQAASALGIAEHSPPAVRAVYDAWCAGKVPRKLGPDRVQDFVDALRVVDACRIRGQLEDIALRRLSVELFRDTKRIEAITGALDVLTGELSASPRLPEEVWAALGLVKFPQPILCAGNAAFHLRDGVRLRLPRPYLGLPTGEVVDVALPPECAYVLSVENLTTFNELARERAGPVTGLVIYTGGMPSPSLLAIYRMILGAMPAGCPLWHWGDIDLGGYRIAATLHAEARRHDRAMRLFNMDPSRLAHVPSSGPLGPNEMRDMIRLARLNGWGAEAAGIEAVPLAYEQEALAPKLPVATGIETPARA